MRSAIIVLAMLALTACNSVQSPVASSPRVSVINAPTSVKPMKNKVFVSNYDFATTVAKIQKGVSDKGMTVFATIDHQSAADKVGLSMQPATVIIFGTPKAGTPLMIKDPQFALQLPLKALVTESNGKVEVVMTDTANLIGGSQLTMSDVENNLAKAVGLVESLVK